MRCLKLTFHPVLHTPLALLPRVRKNPTAPVLAPVPLVHNNNNVDRRAAVLVREGVGEEVEGVADNWKRAEGQELLWEVGFHSAAGSAWFELERARVMERMGFHLLVASLRSGPRLVGLDHTHLPSGEDHNARIAHHIAVSGVESVAAGRVTRASCKLWGKGEGNWEEGDDQ